MHAHVTVSLPTQSEAATAVSRSPQNNSTPTTPRVIIRQINKEDAHISNLSRDQITNALEFKKCGLPPETQQRSCCKHQTHRQDEGDTCRHRTSKETTTDLTPNHRTKGNGDGLSSASGLGYPTREINLN